MLPLERACDRIALAIVPWEHDTRDLAAFVADITEYLRLRFPAASARRVQLALRAAVARRRLAGAQEDR